MPHINGVLARILPWGPHNVIEYNWMYRCYGFYNVDTIKSVNGGKNSKTATHFTFLLSHEAVTTIHVDYVLAKSTGW